MGLKINIWVRRVIVILFFGAIFLYFLRILPQIPYHLDEISWFYHTIYYEELFLKRNISGEIWQSYENYDHPPLAKYIFGQYLYLSDKSVFNRRDELEAKWGRWNFYFDPKLGEIGESEFAAYIHKMREVSLTISILSVLMLYLILVAARGEWWLAMFVSGLLAVNPLFQESMLRATSDSLYIFLMLLGVMLMINYLKVKRWHWLIIGSGVCGLAVAAKLTGLSAILGLTSGLLIDGTIHAQRLLRRVIEVAVIIAVAFIIWVLINPALYGSPFYNTLTYGMFRIRQSYVLANYFSGIALPGINEKLVAIMCTMFGQCVKYPVSGRLWSIYGVDFILFLVGAIYSIKKFIAGIHIQTEKIVLGGVVVVWICVTGLSLPFYSERYFLPVVVGISLVEYMVLHLIWKLINNRFGIQKNSA